MPMVRYLFANGPMENNDILSERIFRALNNWVNAITRNAPVRAFSKEVGKKSKKTMSTEINIIATITIKNGIISLERIYSSFFLGGSDNASPWPGSAASAAPDTPSVTRFNHNI